MTPTQERANRALAAIGSVLAEDHRALYPDDVRHLETARSVLETLAK